MNTYDDVLAAFRKIEELPPMPTRLECGHAVWQLIADEAKWQNNRELPPMPWELDQSQLPTALRSVQVFILRSMPVGAWRFLDQHGQIIAQGTL